ncbi:hypothetical protein [Stieleria mannarensis]|uniref:hypothetical protein n=1 Tax=Stieleria mannarensis TaxID=2755585 RepID=UPI001603D2ED|nr:hypothetical protein [Rhodopirellula sp. JC639]
MKTLRKYRGASSDADRDDGPRQPGALFDYPVRLLVYAMVAFLICNLVLLAARGYGPEVIARENGPVELAQAMMAMFAAGCLFLAASRMQFGRPLLVVCGCLVGYAAARECDSWFETVFFDDAYKYLAGIPLFVIGAVALYRGRKQAVDQSLALLRTPAMTLFVFAGLYVCTVCQAIDVPDLWTAIGPSPAAEMTKAAVEEFSELFGYLLLSISGVESLAMAFAASESEGAEVEEAAVAIRKAA